MMNDLFHIYIRSYVILQSMGGSLYYMPLQVRQEFGWLGIMESNKYHGTNAFVR